MTVERDRMEALIRLAKLEFQVGVVREAARVRELKKRREIEARLKALEDRVYRGDNGVD